MIFSSSTLVAHQGLEFNTFFVQNSCVKEIKNELVELRKDVTSLELTIIDESNHIKKEQDLQHENSERIMAYVDEIQKKVGIKTESQRKN